MRCAVPGTISGGPKDETPPKVVKSTPPNYSTNINSKKVKIEFDEFITLKDINQQFNVSPPLKKKPKLYTDGKSIYINGIDSLKDTTTYTLSFGNSIADNNEGNILQNFEYVFSTGNYLDSLGIYGYITDAFTLQPSNEPFLLMLYNDNSDSAVFKEKPIYTGRSMKNGLFNVSHIKPGRYKIYCIKDKNSNYLYDPVIEPIGFCDSIIYININTIKEQKEKLNKSNSEFTLAKAPDSLFQNHYHIDMLYFTELNKKQFIKNYNRPMNCQLMLKFNNPIRNDSITITPLYQNPINNWDIREMNMEHDSILVWLTDTNMIKSDTIRLKIEYWKTNKKEEFFWASDTIIFRFSQKSTKEDNKKMKIKLQYSDQLDLNQNIKIETSYPIDSFTPSNLQLKVKKDSIFENVKFEVIPDSLSKRIFSIKTNWLEQSKYELTIYPNCFINIYKIPSDTLITNFSTQKQDFYGSLNINLTDFPMPVIVQLLEVSKSKESSSEKVMYEKYALSNGKITFDYLNPKEYTLKIIIDTDKNKKYSTGSILDKKQPEKVLYYKEKIKIRSNWEMETNWNYNE